MPLPLGTPVELPSRLAVQAPYRWFTEIHFQCPMPGMEGTATVTQFPMTADQKLLTRDVDDQSLGRTLVLDQCLYECMREVPEVAAVMAALFVAIPKAEKWLADREAARLAAQDEQGS